MQSKKSDNMEGFVQIKSDGEHRHILCFEEENVSENTLFCR